MRGTSPSAVLSPSRGATSLCDAMDDEWEGSGYLLVATDEDEDDFEDDDVDEDSVVEDPLSWAPVAVQAVTAVSERRRAPVRALLAKGRVLEMKGFIAQLPFSYVT